MMTIPRLKEDFRAACVEVNRVIDLGCDQRTILEAIDTRNDAESRLIQARAEMGEDWS